MMLFKFNKVFTGILMISLASLLGVSVAYSQQPVSTYGGGQTSSGTSLVDQVKKGKSIKPFTPTVDSTEQGEIDARAAEGYAPLYIVTRTQTMSLPGWMQITAKDRNGNQQQLSMNRYQACPADQKTNDVIGRVRIGTQIAWYSFLKRSGCVGPGDICGACAGWSSSFIPSCKPSECGDGAWYNRIQGADAKSLPQTYSAGKTCKYNSVLDSNWAWAEEVSKDTPLSSSVIEVVIRRSCYYTDWAKTTPDRN